MRTVEFNYVMSLHILGGILSLVFEDEPVFLFLDKLQILCR